MTLTASAVPSTPTDKRMHVALWIAQGLLGAVFLLAGATHAFMPIEEAARNSPWIADVPLLLTRFVGVAELAGGLGVVLPSATRVSPGLTPLAASGLVVVMVLAAGLHLVRGEANVIIVNVVFATLAAFVAWGRTKRAPITKRG